MSKLIIKSEQPFSFKHTVYSHGWVALDPNKYDKESRILKRVEQLSSGKVIMLNISGDNNYINPKVTINIEDELATPEKKEIKKHVQHILRIDEDFTDFYKMCRKKGGEWKTLTKGMGRLMRSSTLWEDIVKTICTTNVQWGGTKGMVKRLVQFYGEPLPGNKELRSFPTPQKIAKTNFKKFDEKVRMGYRSEYVHLLAKQIVKGEIILEELTDKKLSTEDVKKKLLKIKGIGNYAAATLLMILERYDEIPVDTVFRDFMKNKYFDGTYPGDKKALSIYDEWNEKKFLAYWFDLWQFYHEDV